VKKRLKTIKEIAQEFLKNLDVEAKVEVSEGEEGAVQVNLDSPDQGVLIGYHGKTLASFQWILSMMAYRKLGEWTRILVDVGDYRQRRQERLEAMAQNAAKRVKFSGEAYALPYLSSAERRIIHMALADDSEVATESEGEGRERRVIVKPEARKQ
jgi:spoIIIJ-associated protein